jgi:hypothetical protein
MPAQEGLTSEWNWFSETPLQMGGTLMFARGISPERIMQAYSDMTVPAVLAEQGGRGPEPGDGLLG